MSFARASWLHGLEERVDIWRSVQKAPACCFVFQLGIRIKVVCLPCYRKPQALLGILFSLTSARRVIVFCLYLPTPCLFWETFPGTWKNQLGVWVWKLTLVRPALLGPLLVPRMLLLPLFYRRGFWVEKGKKAQLRIPHCQKPNFRGTASLDHTLWFEQPRIEPLLLSPPHGRWE